MSFKSLACVIVMVLLFCLCVPAYAQSNLPEKESILSTTEQSVPPDEGKPVRVFVILGIILCLFGLFSGHDWTLFGLRAARMENPEYYSRYAKFSVTFLSAVLIWTAGKYAFDPLDARRLAIAYSFIVLGDVIFFFNVHSRWGVLSFAFAHFLLIRRNAFGLSDLPEHGTMWVLLAAILGGSVLAMFLVFYPKLKHNLSYFSLLTGYAIVIGASFWAALAAFKIGYFPRGNVVLIAVGVACFFLSDVCVGFYRSLPKNYIMVFATYLTWVFYTPALVLTAMSAYDLGKVFGVR